jgi:hypothetical protein
VLDDASRQLTCSVVASVALVWERGRFAPVTASGNVVVDAVSASSLVSFGRWPLRVLKAHHALLVAAHAVAGRFGLRVFDVLHAPFYRARCVPQPTNGAVARTLLAAGAAPCGALAGVTSMSAAALSGRCS